MPGYGAPAPVSPPRRLSREARRRQLIAAAMPLAARQGLAGLSLEDLAVRAGVTRNLLYHYFPRGRPDVVLAAVREAERQLAPPPLPLDADPATAGGAQAANSDLEQAATPHAIHTALLDHALAPTHAWRIHRLAVVTAEPELRAAVARVTEQRVRSFSLAYLGAGDPQPLADAALRGYLAFAEAALDRGRTIRLARAELARLLDQTLRATLDAATA